MHYEKLTITIHFFKNQCAEVSDKTEVLSRFSLFQYLESRVSSMSTESSWTGLVNTAGKCPLLLNN